MEDKVYVPILQTISVEDIKIDFTTETFSVNFSEILTETI